MTTPNLDPTMLPAPQQIANELFIPTLTGGTISLILCGMCIPRLLDYYSHFPKDRRRNKVAVSIVGLGVIFYAVLQVIFIVRTGSMSVHTMAGISGYDANTSIFPIAYIVISLPTHLILAERAWRLNRNNALLAVWLGLAITASLAISIALVVFTFLIPKHVFTYGPALSVIIPVSAVTSLITDLTIVVSILFGLRRTSNGFLASPTEGFGGVNLIRAAWKTSVESAMFPTLLNITILVLHYVKTTGLLFTSSCFMLPPVYCMTLLFSLERRQAHLDASHFHIAMLSGAGSLPCVRPPPTTNTASPATFLTHTVRHSKDSIDIRITLCGDTKGQNTQRPGPVVEADESTSDQPCSHQLK